MTTYKKHMKYLQAAIEVSPRSAVTEAFDAAIALMRAAEAKDEAAEREHCRQAVIVEYRRGTPDIEDLLLRERAAARAEGFAARAHEAQPGQAMTDQTREGALVHRALPDGRDLSVYPYSAGQAQLALAVRGSGVIDESYVYPSPKLAIEAAGAWDGNGDAPVGWIRHHQTGRRRPDGDPAREHVQW